MATQPGAKGRLLTRQEHEAIMDRVDSDLVSQKASTPIVERPAVLEIVRHCETCRHWEFDVHSSRFTPRRDWTAACGRTRWNGDYPEDRTTKANAFGYDGGEAVLMTHIDFGCIQHEAKDGS